MSSICDHSLGVALKSLLVTDDSGGFCPAADRLRGLLDLTVVHSVATYVVTSEGNAFLLHVPGTKWWQSKRRAFGGCEFDNNVVLRMNSLRLELMDEGSVLWNETDIKRSTPILVAPHPEKQGKLDLLQAVQLEKDGVSMGQETRPLFSLEAGGAQ